MDKSIEKRLEILVSKQFAEGLDSVEAKELECLLLSSDEARSCYLKHCQLHSLLLEEHELLEELSGEVSLDNVIAMYADEAPASESNEEGASKKQGRKWLWWGMAAASVAIAAYVLTPGENESGVGEPHLSAHSSENSFRKKGDGSKNPLEAYARAIASLPTSGSMDRPVARSGAERDGSIVFNRDIRPILSDNCFHCHGPDKNTREAKLRLDTYDGILSELGDGRRVIIPGDPANSEFFKRIISDEEDMVMPPPKSHKHLKEEDIQLFHDWIAQGANWEDHWSYNAIARPEVPAVREQKRVQNPIDAFILRRVEEAELTPAEEADRETLVRRVSFDVRGLPPSNEEVKQFVNDPTPNAYETMVNRMLASKQYGEHRARYWLDAARYSDTHGFHFDNFRSVWPYRDWVVDAFNENMPFDRFTVEQIAGDLLPNPTQSQLVATGFNRCNPTTNEAGTLDEEYNAIYALDRVETTSTVWLGMTMGCAACHDHKFDPISQKEFYQMSAFFRNTTQIAKDNNAPDTLPSISIYTDEQLKRRDELNTDSQVVTEEVLNAIASFIEDSRTSSSDFDWIASDHLEVKVAHEGDTLIKTTKESREVIAGAEEVGNIDGSPGITIHSKTSIEVGDVGDFNFSDPFSISFWLYVPEDGSLDESVEIFGRYDPEQNNTGWWMAANPDRTVTLWLRSKAVKRNTLRYQANEKLKAGSWNHVLFTFQGGFIRFQDTVNLRNAFKMRINNRDTDYSGGLDDIPRFVNLDIKAERPLVLGTQDASATQSQSAPLTIRDLRIFTTVLLEPEQEMLALSYPSDVVRPSREAAEGNSGERLDVDWTQSRLSGIRQKQAELAALRAAAPFSLVMQERKDRDPEAHVLMRGQYDLPGERVSANVPEIFPPLPEGEKANRLSLARWLVDPNNPLPARVTVNRFWQELFGTGLVKTSEDFGSQGEPPSHPELLDWLAAEFIDSDWDVKHMYKLMLMSSTYRQSSRVTEEKLNTDPENRLLARGVRYRLDAEMIRDQALFVSGLLVDSIGGPPVKPYQPDGLWRAVGFPTSNTAKFEVDTGDDLYRRSLYTFWKRTAPPPAMAIFDAPTRENCSVRRERTNTPLQALVLMNDPQFVEAARNLAELILGGEYDNRFAALYQRALGEEPEKRVLQILESTYKQLRAVYQEDPAAAKRLLEVGDSVADASIDPVELASWTMVANQIMNLDAFVTKE